MLEKFNSKPSEADYGVVVPGLAISIEEVLETGIVRNAGDALSYENDIKEPSEIGNYVRDNLDALQIAKELKSSLSAAKDKAPRAEENATSKAAENAAEA